MIARIEVRGEDDPDVAPHVHHRHVETHVVSPSPELAYCRETLLAVIRGVITRLVGLKVIACLGCSLLSPSAGGKLIAC